MQLGTSSCYVIDPGDYSYKIGFGSDPVYCIDEGGVDPEFFYALTQDLNDYSGKKFSFYKTNGNLKKGDSQFNFTFQHVYYNPIQFTVRSGLSSVYICLQVNTFYKVCRFYFIIQLKLGM